MKEIYIGNLLYLVTADDLRELFEPYGAVRDVRVIAEREPRHPHAYAFVDMDDREAAGAIAALDGVDFMGRTLRVEESMSELAFA